MRDLQITGVLVLVIFGPFVYLFVVHVTVLVIFFEAEGVSVGVGVTTVHAGV